MYSLIIADDEKIERKALRLLISNNFSDIHIIEDAVNGIELIEKVMAYSPNIAVVDVNMPGLNGLEAVKMLKQKNISTRIIIHTAYGHFEYAQEALALGADSNKVSIFVPVENELTQYGFRIWSTGLAELIVEKVRRYFEIKVKVGIGQPYGDLEQLTKSYKESINALMDKTVQSSVKHFGDIFSESFNSNLLTRYENDFCRLIAECDYEGCSALIEKVFAELEKSYGIEPVKDMILSFMTLIYKFLSDYNILSSRNIFSVKRFFKGIMEIDSCSRLKVWLKAEIKDIINSIGTEKRQKVNNSVKQALDFINEHYTRDISLDNVAESIGISSYYLSRLFKQELGRNFIDYLTELRITRSIAILKAQECSIKELSESVGYCNSTYFCKVFKKFTGKTIGEFKESLSDRKIERNG